MKTVDEILRPFVAQPSMRTEGFFAVNDTNTRNILSRKGTNPSKVMYDIIACNPELKREENAALLGEVFARVEQIVNRTNEIVIAKVK